MNQTQMTRWLETSQVGDAHPVMTETQVRELLNRQEAAWNRGDGEAYGADLADDCWMTNVLGQTPEGKTAFIERHRQIFGSVFRGSTLRMEILRFRVLTPDVAMVEARATVHNYQALPPGTSAGADGALHARLLQVLQRKDSQWCVVAYHNVDVKLELDRQ